jgi:hypothetical protein
MVAPPVIVNKNGETDSAVHLTLDASFLTMHVTMHGSPGAEP